MSTLKYLVDAASSVAPSRAVSMAAVGTPLPPPMLFNPLLMGLPDLTGGNSLFSSSMAPLWKLPAVLPVGGMPPPAVFTHPAAAAIKSDDSGASPGKRPAEEASSSSPTESAAQSGGNGMASRKSNAEEYGAKRARNNESVRKCRDKKRFEQIEKEKRLIYLERDFGLLKAENDALKSTIISQAEEIRALKQQMSRTEPALAACQDVSAPPVAAVGIPPANSGAFAFTPQQMAQMHMFQQQFMQMLQQQQQQQPRS